MNTILIVLDTWRRDHSGCYGNEWIQTHNINRFAKKSAVFENAYLASYPTLPCRRDIATGKYEFPWRGWGGLEQDDVTLAAALRDAGKLSYFITDVYHHWGRDAGNYWADFTGFDLVRGQERDGYITDTDIEFDHHRHRYPPHPHAQEPHYRNVQYLRKNESDWFSPQVFQRATRWIEHNADHEDFFLMIDSFDPHEPWDPPRYYTDLYGDPNFDGREFSQAPYGYVKDNLSAEELRHVQALYAGEITMLDRWLGHFLQQVEAMGLMDKTMVILTTDHGTHNGDHGRTGKNWVLMEEISHIPLIIWHPEFGHGTRPKQFVQPVDFFPTVLEAAGVHVPMDLELHGHSIIPYLLNAEAKSARDAVVFAEFGCAVNITDGEYKLVQGIAPDNPPLYSYSGRKSKWSSDDWGAFDGTRRLVGPKNASGARLERNQNRLYHLATDPGEKKNIFAECPEIVQRLQAILTRKLKAIGAPDELLDRFDLR